MKKISKKISSFLQTHDGAVSLVLLLAGFILICCGINTFSISETRFYEIAQKLGPNTKEHMELIKNIVSDYVLLWATIIVLFLKQLPKDFKRISNALRDKKNRLIPILYLGLDLSIMIYGACIIFRIISKICATSSFGVDSIFDLTWLLDFADIVIPWGFVLLFLAREILTPVNSKSDQEVKNYCWLCWSIILLAFIPIIGMIFTFYLCNVYIVKNIIFIFN